MTLKTEISSEVNEKDWNNLLLKNSASTAYQTANWPKIYQHAYDSKPVYIRILSENGETLGQLASVIHTKLFWQDANIISSFIGKKFNLRSVFNWFYGPIIHNNEKQDEILATILNAIRKTSKKEKITMVRGISPPISCNFSNQEFQNSNYGIESWSTYITHLDLNSDELYDSLNKKIRYDIRKSEQNQLQLKIVKNRDEMDDYYKIKLEEKKKYGINIKPNPLFYDAHWEFMFKRGYEKLFLVKYQDEVIGGLFGVIFNNYFLQHGVGNSEKTQLLGGTFLTWNALKWAIENKLRYFDFGGANPSPSSKKESKIDFYKSKWGGRQYPYSLYTKIYSKIKIKISSLVKNPKRSTRIIQSLKT